jgi:hypothetical protein
MNSSSSSSSKDWQISLRGSKRKNNQNKETRLKKRIRLTLEQLILSYKLFPYINEVGDEVDLAAWATACSDMKNQLDALWEESNSQTTSSSRSNETSRLQGVIDKFVEMAFSAGDQELKVVDEWIDKLTESVNSLQITDSSPSSSFLPPIPRSSSRVEWLKVTGNPSVHSLSLPKSLKVLNFDNDFDRPVSDLELPSKLEELNFGDGFNQSIDQLALPNGLKRLSFGIHFNQPLSRVRFPDSIEELEFGFHFNQPLQSIRLPTGLKKLTLGDHFDQPVDNIHLPRGLVRLKFGARFNQPVFGLNLPGSLEELVFGRSFNQPVGHLILPRGLLTLRFGDSFNQPVDRLALPNNLRVLYFGQDFDQSINDLAIPPGLKMLDLCREYRYDQHRIDFTRLPHTVAEQIKKKLNYH